MRKDKVRAFKLRRKNKSYSEINRILGIPKSTLADWFNKLDWSNKIKGQLLEKIKPTRMDRIRLMTIANSKKWSNWRKKARESAVIEFKKLKKHPLFISGIMLYWGEGDKILKNGRVSLSNSDPEMIRVFYVFLKNILRVPESKIRLSLILYPDLVDSVQKNLWSKLTNIPIQYFNNSVFIQGRHPTKRNSYGVCLVRVCDVSLKEKIMKWIELLQISLTLNQS